MDSKIKNFFYPSSIALIGASSKEKSIGYELLKSIKKYNYTGNIFPVNPKSSTILGFDCFNDIISLPNHLDLAIIVVPKIFVEETIDQLLDKKVKSIILVTAGFKEVGGEGIVLENRVKEKIHNAGARLVGPNCMGVISTLENVKLNATFVAELPLPGRTAFLSQSGAIGAAVLNSLRETDIRFGHFISVGNKADISENDLLEFWEKDENIDTITCYLESFSDGEQLIQKFIDSKITKPVIILKSGKSSAGMKAASSHTGALGSSDKVVNAIMNQFGIIRAQTLSELFNTAKGFEDFSIPQGNKIAIVTNAGGPAILAVDSLENGNLCLAELSDATKMRLKAVVHPEGSINNPVDLLPGGTAQQYKIVNEILLSDIKVDAVISIFVEPVMVSPLPVIESINEIKSSKPIYQVVMPLPEFWEEYRKNSKFNKPLFRNPEEPAKVISNILFFNKKQNHKEYLYLNKQKKHFEFENGFLSSEDIRKIFAKYDLPIIEEIISSPEEAGNILSKIKFPVVVKGISKTVVHKSELNGVKLNINSPEQFIKAVNEIEESFKQNSFILENILIQPFIKTKFELLIGGFRDSAFGPIIMFGSGGKYVEVFNDTALKSAYLNDDDIDEIINSTKIGKILHGVRGENSIDFTKLKSILKNCAQMMIDIPSIKEFDINPLIVSADDSLHAVDIRIKNEWCK